MSYNRKITVREYSFQKGLPRSITIKCTAREYQKQKYSQCMSQSKGSLKLIIIKTTARPREWQYQNNGQGTQQPNELPGSVQIKGISRQCHNKKNCKGVSQSNLFLGVSQSKGLPGTSTFKMTVRQYHNQKCQGVPHSI